MALSPFFFNQSRFRRILLLLIFLLLVAYIYVSIFGQVEIDEKMMNRVRDGFRETFQRNPKPLRVNRQENSSSGTSPSPPPPPTISSTPPSSDPTNNNAGPTDEELSQDRFEPGLDLVQRMMKHAWDGYRNYAWGQDELRPVSKGAMGFLGDHSMLVSIVDSLDTLMIMHMDKEYLEARDMVLEKLSFDFPMTVSLFEANIRLLGGLLSAFALSGDSRYVTKAFDLAQRFMAAFEDEIVFPDNTLNLLAHVDPNLKSKAKKDDPNRVVFLAQAGTFSLEFGYLSDVLNDPQYINKALEIIERMAAMKTSLPGLYPASIYPNRINQPDDYYSMGGQCDSFYEYLLKYWLYTGKRHHIHNRLYKNAVEGIKKHLLQKRQGRWFMVNKKADQVVEEQEHLACFAPGMLALGARAMDDQETFKLAESLTESCYLMYHKQRIGLSPEYININTFRPTLHKTYWSMRPEVLESIFVMWRLTGDPKYRRWGYEIAQNIEKWAKVETGGYSGIENILMDPIKFNDHQESFFLAETLKYLYLLFGSNDVLPLDEWVFNTEAHPFPINWRGTPYATQRKTATAPAGAAEEEKKLAEAVMQEEIVNQDPKAMKEAQVKKDALLINDRAAPSSLDAKESVNPTIATNTTS